MTVSRVLTPEQYTQHLKKYCGLKDDEIKIVLDNVYKRMKKEKQIEKNIKIQKKTK